MKKRIAILLTAVSLLMLFAGCASKTNDPDSPWRTSLPFGTKTPITSGFAMVTLGPRQTGGLDLDIRKREPMLYWDTFRNGGSTSDRGTTYKVYTDRASFERELGEHASEFGEHYSEKSFESAFIVAVYVTVPTGGYSFSAESVKLNGNTLDIKIAKTAPANGTVVTQAFEEHCVLIAIDSKLYSDDLVYNIEYEGKNLSEQ